MSSNARTRVHACTAMSQSPSPLPSRACVCLRAAQLGKLQADMEALREQRENTISTTREELYSAQEEVLRLHLVVLLNVQTSVLVVQFSHF